MHKNIINYIDKALFVIIFMVVNEIAGIMPAVSGNIELILFKVSKEVGYVDELE
jgi:hypothetical protein